MSVSAKEHGVNTNPQLKIWKTGHQIADTVAEAFARGNYKFDADLVYGILRHNVFDTAEHWLEVDNGYFNPGHFGGNYRISYKGTQAKWHEGIPQKDIGFELEAWKPRVHWTGKEKKVLICPPTNEVKKFFDLKEWQVDCTDLIVEIREKGAATAIDWENIGGVITFNSSVGWEALRRGIPCISDTEHSIVGSYYKHELGKLNLDYTFENVLKISREPLFKGMRAHQFTLAEIEQGRAWELIKHYIS